jgi:hypothetical protein
MILSSSAVWAGGWAMTILDSTPGELRSGETYEVGYTILQHGIRPAAVDHTEIRLHGPWKVGETHAFRGVQQGPEGHYVATVTIPGPGEYRWEVTQGPFPNHDLGRFTAGDPVASESLTATDLLRTALPIGALICAAFVLWQWMNLPRRRPLVDAA